MSINRQITTTLLLSALISSAASAADTGLYLYGSAGATDTPRKEQADTVVKNLGVTSFTSTADERDVGYKLQLGYRFNPYVALEGGYVNLGRYDYTAASTAPAATRQGTIKVDGWNFGGVGSIQFTDGWAGFAKLGFVASEVAFSCGGTGTTSCSNPSRTAHGLTPYYGLGLDWKFTPNWFARAEFEVFSRIGDSFNTNGTTGTSRADIRMGSLGIGYRF